MKNLLVVCIDSLRADSFRELLRRDDSRIATALKTGVVFPCVYSAAPWTYPSTHSILTGVLPSVHGARHHGTYRRGVDSPWPEQFDSSCPTMFSELAAAGYATFGISTIYWALNERQRYDGCDVIVRSAQQNIFYRCTPASWVIGQFRRLFNERLAHRKFAGYLHFMDLHRPYQMESARPFLPPRFRSSRGIVDWNEEPSGRRGPAFRRAKRAAYEALLRYLDTEIGTLFDALHDAGVYADTTVILLSDHGEAFWDHYEFEKAHYDCGKKSSLEWLIGTGHGHTLFDEVLRVPLAIVNPPDPVPRKLVDSPVSTLDVFPTILDWAGLRPRRPVDGRSLARPVEARALRAEATLYGFERKAVVCGTWKCVASPGDRSIVLFDRERDPEERHPLPPSAHPTLVRSVLSHFGAEELA